MKSRMRYKSIGRNSNQEKCTNRLELRQKYKRYHRFFMISPFFIVTVLVILFVSTGRNFSEISYKLLLSIAGIFVVKEIMGLFLSSHIYENILRPVEDLKKGFYEVSNGNYDVEIIPGMAPEITELINAFNHMSQQLKASEIENQKYEKNRKELIASISHDLKTPITSINGFVDGILEGVADTPEKKEAYVRIIQQNARYLNRLIDDLLLYSKLDLHKLNFECSTLSIGDYISELYKELELEHEENGVQMVLKNALQTQIILEIDSKLMTRAIRNIVSNAIIYGKKESPKIEFDLYLKKNQQSICLEISDNGHGIPEEQLDSIFERFYRGDHARTTSSGSSGLGLAIAQEIVGAHKGNIWAKSILGSGTTIGIELPIQSLTSRN